VGVATLLFMLGTGRMFSRRHDRHSKRHGGRHAAWSAARAALRPSGKPRLRCLQGRDAAPPEEEQAQFEAFLHRLREAKDKAEFDEFMEDRARRASDRSFDGDREGPEAA
jgi:hypothetical protein